MGRGVWADGQDMQELLEDDLPGKLVQLESIRLPATGQDTATASQRTPVSQSMVHFFIFWKYPAIKLILVNFLQ